MACRPIIFAALLLGLAPSVWSLTEQEFDTCMQQLGERAVNEGLPRDSVDRLVKQTALNQRVIELDRRQPEFTTSFADYYQRRVNETRTQRGRELLSEHRELLDALTRQYGVPGHYLVSFWGLETNYGGYKGNISTLDALATLACEGRRATYFSAEYINALRLLNNGDVDPDIMTGSWAGAMGHVQFMPENYLRFAVDHDGSGRRDLFNSIPDAMASAANFLEALGWQRGERWGREVQLPSGFDYSLAGLNRRKTVSEWSQQGVRMASGGALPNSDISASLLVPSGHNGPAFLVYDNFRVIMRWNRSESYAITVGRLADRITGAGPLHRAPVDSPRLHRDHVRVLQRTLQQKGFDPNGVDGLLGPGTRNALAQFQNSQGWVADGFPDERTLNALGVLAEDS